VCVCVCVQERDRERVRELLPYICVSQAVLLEEIKWKLVIVFQAKTTLVICHLAQCYETF